MFAARICMCMFAVVTPALLARKDVIGSIPEKLSTTNIICKDEMDRKFERVYSGIIQDAGVVEDRDCKMALSVQGSVRVEVVVNSLHFSSGDCDEEYFCIKDSRGHHVPNMTLCHGTLPGTTLLYEFTAGNDTGSEVIFQLRMEEESDLPKDRQSFVDISFRIMEATSDEILRNDLSRNTTGTPISYQLSPSTIPSAVTRRSSLATGSHASDGDRDLGAEALNRWLSGSEAIIDDDMEEEDEEEEASSSSGIESLVLGLSLGLVIMLLIVIIVVLAMVIMRGKRSSCASAHTEESSRTRAKDSNVHVVATRRPSTPETQRYLNSSPRGAQSKHLPLARKDAIHSQYSEIPDSHGQRYVLPASIIKPANSITRTFSNRLSAARLLDSDMLDKDNYHRLEALHERTIPVNPRMSVGSVRYGAHGGRLGEDGEADSGVGAESDYADLAQMHPEESSTIRTLCRSEFRSQSSRGSCKDCAGAEQLDQFGYVIILPSNTESVASGTHAPWRQAATPPTEETSDYEFVSPRPLSV